MYIRNNIYLHLYTIILSILQVKMNLIVIRWIYSTSFAKSNMNSVELLGGFISMENSQFSQVILTVYSYRRGVWFNCMIKNTMAMIYPAQICVLKHELRRADALFHSMRNSWKFPKVTQLWTKIFFQHN